MRSPLVCESPEFDVAGFEALVGRPALSGLQRLAERLQLTLRGRGNTPTVWHVNSTALGGGVADILNCLVPFSRAIGVTSHWVVIGGDDRFFHITKAFHNALQGDPGVGITDEDLSHYRRTIAANALELEELLPARGCGAPDVIVLHDPQPIGLVAHWRSRYPGARLVWHGHIQFDLEAQAPSHPGRLVWGQLADLVNQCDAAVFHLPQQIPPDVAIPIRCFLPSINPLGYLNRSLTLPAGARFIDATLAKHGMSELRDRAIPLVAQVARFDPWKDPSGVMEAHRQARERLPRASPPPHLLLVGPLADDDPEAFRVLTELRVTVDGDGAVHLLPLRPGSLRLSPGQADALTELGIDPATLRPQDLADLEINAFQTRADVIVAKSVREGFGLAVTGAGYHAKPRIVSEVGGLTAQVLDARGRARACLVGGRPFDREASIRMTRDWLVRLLRAPRLRQVLGTRARRQVVRGFLPHRHLADYFVLFHDLATGQLRPRGLEQRPA